MEDVQIIELFWSRDETAIAETDRKYRRLCFHIARNILAGWEDCEECVSDTWLAAWNSIPTQRPGRFSLFLGKITRNLALKRYEYLSAAKRNAGAAASLDELEECVSGRETVESEVESGRVREVLNGFLEGLDREKRLVFLWRHWFFLSVDEIARRTGYSQSKVKSMLYHTRQALRRRLEEEGIDL